MHACTTLSPYIWRLAASLQSCSSLPTKRSAGHMECNALTACSASYLRKAEQRKSAGVLAYLSQGSDM